MLAISLGKYIIVAKHGFPGGVGDHILHPSRDGPLIAEVAQVFEESDLALAKLADVHSSKETFSAIDAPVRPFRDNSDTTQARASDLIFVDTPFNARCEGILTKADVLRIQPADPARYVHRSLWIVWHWSRHFCLMAAVEA